ncbi:cytochrome P450 [Leucogyrophana mollusca]|uniref:Cytochrome P450 n=1 Tax=Leucogyrophana mollusca TaxID=85980 RepID=A0ACB8BK14_9AGAM|nr:cytochrome P450 [Leucogyrophana mollusca]
MPSLVSSAGSASWSSCYPVLLLVLGVIVLWILSDLILLLARQYTSPLRSLRCPPTRSFLLGNLPEMYHQENTGLLADWEATYGPTFSYKGFFGGCRLLTLDLVAVAHILAESDKYQKPDFVRDNLATMGAGHEGVLTTEGDVHKRQRKILAPAFAGGHIKTLTPIFWDKAIQLRDIWTRMAQEHDTEVDESVDVLVWLSKATLDVIGLAGFGYAFNALAGESNKLADAYHVIFTTARKLALRTILETWIPLLRKFHRHNATMEEAHGRLQRIGLELIDERRRTISSESSAKAATPLLSRPAIQRDLLSVLVQSNLASFASQRMSTSEVLCQISTFLIAGYETSSSALTWCLYALSKSPVSQDALRKALHTIPRDSPTLDEDVNKLEYLDWVVRETLRVHAPVTWTMRVAMEGDEIPVQRPFIDKGGNTRTTIKVNKYDIITIPIQAINKSQSIWGGDAQAFRPERWQNPPEEIKAIQGLYSNTLTFLSGTRGCIGYKFALAEIKIFLYTLVRDLEFSIDSSIIIEKTFKIYRLIYLSPFTSVVARPVVKSETNSGNRMPLVIRLASTPPGNR